MLFLSEEEKRDWRRRYDEIARSGIPAGGGCEGIRPNLVPMFHCYVGTRLAATGSPGEGAAWIRAGALIEEEGIFFNTFMSSFLERQGGRFIMPAVAFQDPAPFIHFAGVPVLKEARARFRTHCAHSLPVFTRPFRIMDLGCGDGGLLVQLLSQLREAGRIGDIADIVLVDASGAMVAMAREKLESAFPGTAVHTVQSRIENMTGTQDVHVDVILSSLAYHHMPRETKLVHLQKLAPWTDHVIIFELDADNDQPEQFSPELAVSVYQAYGRMIDFIFSHDAPLETAIPSVDAFLMTEAVSFFIQERGERSDYHMRNSQWHELLREGLGDSFTCCCDSIAHADEYFSLHTLHYGR